MTSTPKPPADLKSHIAANTKFVYRVILGTGLRGDDVKDIAQDVFESLIEADARNAVDLSKSIRPWLYVNAVRRVVAFRKLACNRGHRSWGFDGKSGEVYVPEPVAHGAGPEYLLALKEGLALFEKLPADERRALEMAVMEDASYQDIGEELGICLATVCTRLRSARRRLESLAVFLPWTLWQFFTWREREARASESAPVHLPCPRGQPVLTRAMARRAVSGMAFAASMAAVLHPGIRSAAPCPQPVSITATNDAPQPAVVRAQAGTVLETPPPALPVPVSRPSAAAEDSDLLALRDAKWAIRRGDLEKARAQLARVKSPRNAEKRRALLEALGQE